MTERMITNRIRRLKELEAQQKQLEQQIEALKSDIKVDMEAKGLDEQKVGDYIVRFTSVLTGRFNARRFQQEHSKLYNQYIKQASSKRFSIA